MGNALGYHRRAVGVHRIVVFEASSAIGRSRRDPRAVWNGILWILRTGVQWTDLPDRYPPYQTCHRYF
ncbi:MAG: hypothetical protein CL933_17010 [Deltaproteobacteria bacterium]|nr:hypothetical protein [Deltaproteobacteria bacterium]